MSNTTAGRFAQGPAVARNVDAILTQSVAVRALSRKLYGWGPMPYRANEYMEMAIASLLKAAEIVEALNKPKGATTGSDARALLLRSQP